MTDQSNDTIKAEQYHRRLQAGEDLTLAEAVDYFRCTMRLLWQQVLRPWRRIGRLAMRPFARPGYQKIWAAYARDRFRRQVDGRRFAPVLRKGIDWMPDRLCLLLFRRISKK
jgi:hypothetical protein